VIYAKQKFVTEVGNNLCAPRLPFSGAT